MDCVEPAGPPWCVSCRMVRGRSGIARRELYYLAHARRGGVAPATAGEGLRRPAAGGRRAGPRARRARPARHAARPPRHAGPRSEARRSPAAQVQRPDEPRPVPAARRRHPARTLPAQARPRRDALRPDHPPQPQARLPPLPQHDLPVARPRAPPRQRRVRLQWPRPGGVLLPALPQAAGAVRPLPRQAAQREGLPLGRGSGETDGPSPDRRGRLAAELHRLDRVRGRGGRRDQGGTARAGPLSLEPRGVGRAVRPGDDRGPALGHPRARHAPGRAAGADHARGGRAVRQPGGDDRRGRDDSHPQPRRLSRAGRAPVHPSRHGRGLRADVPLPPRHGEARAPTLRMIALRRALQERPLLAVLLLAALVRVTAAIFSRGFLAIDDHHVLVDAAERLVSGLGLEVEHKRSILYPGVVALIMGATRTLDDPSPATQLLVVRLVQAAYSLFTVLLVYRILERTATPRTALLGGLLVATFFALPITAVHQFEEAVCQAPLLASCWWLLRAPGDPPRGARCGRTRRPCSACSCRRSRSCSSRPPPAGARSSPCWACRRSSSSSHTVRSPTGRNVSCSPCSR